MPLCYRMVMCLADHVLCANRSSLLFNGCNISAASGAAAAASADGGPSGEIAMQTYGLRACVVSCPAHAFASVSKVYASLSLNSPQG